MAIAIKWLTSSRVPRLSGAACGDSGDRQLGEEQRCDAPGHALGTQKGMEMAQFPVLPAALRMRVKEVLRMAFRIIRLSIGIPLPLADPARRDLVEQFGVPGS